MRQTIRFILLLLLSLLTALSFSACQTEPDPVPVFTPESASALWEKIDQTMNSVEAMDLSIRTERVYYHMGQEYHYSGTSYVLSTKDAHYTTSESLVTCEALSLNQSVKLVEAYYDGMMYRAINNGTYDQKFCSAMSHEDYDGLQTEDITTGFAITDCTSADYTSTSRGHWQLFFSGYTKKTIDNTVLNMGLTEEAMGAPIEDMQVTLWADSDFYVSQMEIVFVFRTAEGEAKPSFAVNMYYSNYNSVTFDPTLLNTQEYVQVEDIRILELLSAAMKERQEAQLGQFTLRTSTTEEYRGQTRTSTEMGTMIYGWKNGAYTYFFTANTDGQSFLVSYQGNEQTVISGGNSYKVEMTEEEAKAYIDGLIDSAKYDPLAIGDIQLLEEGVYLLTSDSPAVASYLDGIEVTSARQQIKAIFSDRKLTQLESKLSIEGIYNEETIAMTTDSMIMFTEITEFPEI